MNIAFYLIQVNICLVFSFLFFILFLQKETFHALNRYYLLFSSLVSFLIPISQMEWFKNIFVKEKLNEINFIFMNASAELVKIPNVPTFSWKDLTIWVYVLGVFVFFVIFCLKIIRLIFILKNKNEIEAFSFFKWIYVKKEAVNVPIMTYHENVHSKQWHSLDVLFFEFLKVFFWFNPVIWMYQRSLKNIHEYIADEKTAAFQGDTAAYALLLLSKSLGVHPLEISNQFFNQSILKQRIKMLHKQKSTRNAILKYGIALPLFALLLVFSSSKIEANESIKDSIESIQFDQSLNMLKNQSSKLLHSELSKATTVAPIIKKRKGQLSNQNDTVKKDTSFTSTLSGKVSRKMITYGKVNDTGAKTSVFKYTTSKHGDKGKNDVFSATTKDAKGINNHNTKDTVQKKGEVFGVSLSNDEKAKELVFPEGKKPLIIVDGQSTIVNLKDIDSDNIESMSVLKDKAATSVYGEKAKNGVVLLTTKKGTGKTSKEINNPLYVVDGKVSKKGATDMDPKSIKSISILKGEHAIKKYGNQAKNGVIEVELKQK